MKTKVIIEDGAATIVLTPENDFEKDVIENTKNKEAKHDIVVSIGADYYCGDYINHKIELSIKDK